MRSNLRAAVPRLDPILHGVCVRSIDIDKESAMNLRDVLPRRLRAVRLDLYGEHGGPLLAEDLRIPTRTGH
jgi:hypothetical protein